MSWTEEALYYAAQSNDLFSTLNCVLERKYRLDKEIEVASIWQTPTNGAQGAGALFEMPRLLVPAPNSQVNQLLFGVVIFEERNINLTPGVGTLKSAEGWAALLLEFMRGWIVGQMGGLTPEPAAISPAEDWLKEGDGILCLRVSMTQKLSRTIYPRCFAPILSDNNYLVTLTPATQPGANVKIFYTTDGTFPGDPAVMTDNASNTQLYTGPFNVAPGTLVQWAAYQSGWFQSNVGQQTIN